MNKVLLLGNVGKSPVVRLMSNGNKVASFSLATSEKWKIQQGKPKKKRNGITLLFWKKGRVR